MDNNFKPTYFSADDALRKAFTGCRARPSTPSTWKYGKNPGDAPFASAFLDSLEGMEEIAGQSAFVINAVNKLPFNEMVAIHAMYTQKFKDNDFGIPEVSHQYLCVLVAMSVVICSLVPSITRKKMRDFLVARALEMPQQKAEKMAEKLGIHEETFGTNFRKVKSTIDSLNNRAMIMITEKLEQNGVILVQEHYENG